MLYLSFSNFPTTDDDGDFVEGSILIPFGNHFDDALVKQFERRTVIVEDPDGTKHEDTVLVPI